MSDNFASHERRSIISVVIIIIFIAFAYKLVSMQIFQYKLYDTKSSSNSIKAKEITPLRGVLLDRNLRLLVHNIPAYTLRITPAEYDTNQNKMIEAVLGFEPGSIKKLLYQNRIYSKNLPIRVKRGIDFSAVSWFEENQDSLKGIDYIVEMQRGYDEGLHGAHLFGYSKEISANQLKKENDYYNPGDYVGHSGIERAYEKYLRGDKGFNYVLVDSRRKEIGKYQDGMNDKKSIKGKDLVLSIDADVQKVAEEELRGKRGAVVAIEPKTGEIIALVSSPDYDLNQFSYATPRAYLQQLYTDKEKPLFNRATMSVKPPGSTFKILAAIAALDMGIITENSTIFCGGSFFFGRSFKCHGAHGSVNVVHAIEKSCNVFFYQLIYKIGLDRWAEYCHKFGFASKTGIDIGEEVAGFIPSSKFYEKQYKGDNWPRSIMASLGIGQGEVSVTPVQLAKYTALIANDGFSYIPHVVKGYLDDSTKKIVNLPFDEIRLNIPKRVFDIVKKGMFLVVNGAGTATSIKLPDIQIAGKTGTAQNPHGLDHAFFIGFAPFDNPKIAFAIVVENIGFGGTWAAPIAKKMVMAYLQKEKWREEMKNGYQSIYSNQEADVENEN